MNFLPYDFVGNTIHFIFPSSCSQSCRSTYCSLFQHSPIFVFTQNVYFGLFSKMTLYVVHNACSFNNMFDHKFDQVYFKPPSFQACQLGNHLQFGYLCVITHSVTSWLLGFESFNIFPQQFIHTRRGSPSVLCSS